MTPVRDAEFCEYVAARGERLRRFAYLCCGDWHRAEDAVQTALVRLYRAWPRVRPATVDAYTRRIVVNILISESRRLRFQRERVTDEPPETTARPDATAERVTLVAALLCIPGRLRAAVVLRYWEDLSVEQTARILGCSSGAVKNLSMRGLAALRERLTDTEFARIEGVQP
ncbi:SigE family RNA polymerase sigma factor [Phytomonospora endophytica]|uniref:RNA polymerase sigma-70 factor (Sigma-E family) n=1 Tax=Phytomonospora endophytica TaxID=714109 RepID=A0A841FSR6_9ACTN|nr:SigE family RNA polymerase sigma factor [Phytomonospora endophytica]MBB6036357.1 RNA polymerase sigma-70 factor (sigma-E family) [Phytomonospora endophytica]GIG67264.1 RNA polymerase sigma24 factor [Phytomonospora endophytica]